MRPTRSTPTRANKASQLPAGSHNSSAMPNAIRYSANGAKLCCLM